MQALIRKAGSQLVRRRFGTTAELISAVYASLVDYLAAKELVRTGPFDTMVCRDATLDDLSEDKILQFVRLARHARGFPLPQVGRHQGGVDALESDPRRTAHACRGAAVRLRTAAVPAVVRGQVCPFPRYAGGQADPVVSGLQGDGLRSGGPSRGFCAVEDQSGGGHAGALDASPGGLRDAAGGGARGDRQCRGSPRLHQHRQRAGHVVRRPAGSLEPRHTAAAAHPGNAPPCPTVRSPAIRSWPNRCT